MKNLFIPFDLEQKIILIEGSPNCVEVRYTDGESQGFLYQQIVDWFRIKYHIIITPDVDIIGNTFCHIKSPRNKVGFWSNDQSNPLEYYTSLNKAIEEAFKLI